MSIIKHVTLQKIVAHDFRYDLVVFAVAFVDCSAVIIDPVAVAVLKYQEVMPLRLPLL